MPEPTPNAIARVLRVVTGPDPAAPADGELLARFASSGDPGAFELLVWRHAGMVSAVCRRILRDRHLAEDATQAAFLALAKQAKSVRDCPAGWLYRVARRIACRMTPSKALDIPERTESISPDPDDVAALHDELANLPEKYRVPVLLCFFEGLTHEEAAKRLGWPTGSVAGRIARAKEMLHARLTRRGVAVPVIGLAAFGVVEGVPKSFAVSTARAAVAYAAGQFTELSPTVTGLAGKAMTAMTIAKLQTAGLAATIFVAVATTAWGVFALPQQTTKPSAPSQPQIKPPIASEIKPDWWLVTREEKTARQTMRDSMREGMGMTRDSLPLHGHMAVRLIDVEKVVLPNAESTATNSPGGKLRLLTNRNQELLLEDRTKETNAYDRYRTIEKRFVPSKFESAWSSDAKHFAFVSNKFVSDNIVRDQWSLVLQPVTSGSEARFVSSNSQLNAPRFLAGGDSPKVVFLMQSGRAGKESLYDIESIEMKAGGEAVKRETIVKSVNTYDLAVSPDGKQIAYGSSTLNIFDLELKKVVAEVKMSEVNKDWPVVFTNLTWRSDGNAIAFKPKFVGGISVGPGQNPDAIRTPGDAHVGVIEWPEKSAKPAIKLFEIGRNFIPAEWTTSRPQAAQPVMAGGMGMGAAGGEAGMGGPPGQAAGGGGEGGGPPSNQAEPPIVRLNTAKDAKTPVTPEDPKRIADFKAREESKEKLKKIAMAMHNYEAAYGHWPSDRVDDKGKAIWSWRVELLPYFGDDKLNQLHQTIMKNPASAAQSLTPDIYRSAFQAKETTETYFQLFSGPSAVGKAGSKQRIASVTDGTSNTMGVAEVGPAVNWMKPGDVPYHPGKAFPKVTIPYANVVMTTRLDGSFVAMKPDVGEYQWRLLIEHDDGHNIDHDTTIARFPAESKEEKALLDLRIQENALRIAKLEQLQKELIALMKQENARQLAVDEAKKFGESLDRLREMWEKLRNGYQPQPKTALPPAGSKK